ncbi:MAG: membrane protein insertase YidC [Sphingomonadaceae bacterium]|nr:membrane protein insertase YidC [Sphingomonadaceae bacterium]
MNDQRNLILAFVLAFVVIFGWGAISNKFFPVANKPATQVVDGKTQVVPNPSAAPAPEGPTAVRARAAVLAGTPRVKIATPKLAGSINLRGARIDDLVLVTQRETIAKNSPPIRLLSPEATPGAYYAGFGWSGDGVALPGPDTVWTASGGDLTPDHPVTLSWTNGAGQSFAIRLAIDDGYMFAVTQSVANGGTAAVSVRPYALIDRTGQSPDKSTWTAHTGPMGFFNNAADYGVAFKDLDANPQGQHFQTTGGWLGFGDKYWLTALVPDQGSAIDAAFRSGGGQRYQAEFTPAASIVPPGKAVSYGARLFAGAKEVTLLDRYKGEGIAGFDRAIDWGWFIWFEKPIFYLLDWLFRMCGNFGVAIILLTLIVRGLMFPIAQRQFKSMAAMRTLQPKMKALQERHKDDKPRLQQEMMKLYQEEKVNPIGGCLPIFLQIPIFYALYKVLLLTIDMRHQPFVLWIKDLSAPDPLTPVNLFGLLAFEPPAFLHLGVLAILLGITMYLQFRLNPQPMDEAQKQVFAMMPWVMMFVFAPFAAGLQLYYVMSNTLTILQQRWLYSRNPVLKAAPAK